MDRFVVQTVTQIEYTVLDDGTTKHRLVKAFSTIIGEPKKKTAKKPVDIAVSSSSEEFVWA